MRIDAYCGERCKMEHKIDTNPSSDSENDDFLEVVSDYVFCSQCSKRIMCRQEDVIEGLVSRTKKLNEKIDFIYHRLTHMIEQVEKML